jgi:exodeoxyribonuclease VII small subunit
MTEESSQDFEASFRELESIVRRLEGEQLPLDESLSLFEKGIQLSRFCHQKLSEVEKKIELILADAKGEPEIRAFPSEAKGGEPENGDLPADEDDIPWSET